MFHVKLDLREALEGFSRTQREQLDRFASLLLGRAIPLGFVSAADKDRLWERHILDCLRALACLGDRPLRIVDVGSGAGLPGLPIAIARPDCTVVLLEAMARRAAFAELAVERLALANVQIVIGRAELSGVSGDVAVARALAPPRQSWEICSPLTRPKGFVLYFAGQSWAARASRTLDDLQVEWKVCIESEFPWQGPIVKMTRKRPSA